MRKSLMLAVALGVVLAGCASTTTTSQSSLSPIGTNVRWHGSLYKIVGVLSRGDVWQRLGTVQNGRHFTVYHVDQHGMIPANELAFVAPSGASRNVAYRGVSLSLDNSTWHIGRYTVRELRLPSDYISSDYILGTTLLTVGTTSPYTVTYRSLVSKRTATVTLGDCETQPFWEHDDSLPWPEAPLICVQQKSKSLLYLIGNDGGSTSVQLPARPRSAGEYSLWALGYAGSHFQHLFWEVQQSEGPAPLIGSGLLNLQTGQESPVPKALNTALFVSPDGTLYGVTGNELSYWNGSSFVPLGALSNLSVEAVDDAGAAWASASTEGLMREVPGTGQEQSWTVPGFAFGYGPGYIVWGPNPGRDGPIRVTFPLQGRTLSFNGGVGEALVYGQTNSVLTQTMFRTATGAEVLEISTAPRLQ